MSGYLHSADSGFIQADYDTTLYLGPEGDGVTLKSWDAPLSPAMEAVAARATECKTHAQVLAFLESIQGTELEAHLRFFHNHNTNYRAHVGSWPKGAAHLCPLARQIEFVRFKILEAKVGSQPKPVVHPFLKAIFS